MYFQTKFQIGISNGSSLGAIEPKVTENFHPSFILLPYIVQKYNFNKSRIFFQYLLPYIDPAFPNMWQECRYYLTDWSLFEVSSNGETLVQSLMKFGQFVPSSNG
jgi:hypothetical protein